MALESVSFMPQLPMAKSCLGKLKNAALDIRPREMRPILWFDEIGMDDVTLVGGKSASLGEMYCQLTSKGVKVPNGFAITAFAYRQFVKSTGLDHTIHAILGASGSDWNIHDLAEHGARVRNAICKEELPADLKEAICSAYDELCYKAAGSSGKVVEVDVAVRSSATAEDLPDASFAGQQETYLNVRGQEQLLASVKRCFASLFTDRAISYREHKRFDHFAVDLSVAVQLMVRSDLACSGVMFSLDTESGFPDVVLINASYGLGENIVGGTVNPDEFVVHKPTLVRGHQSIVSKVRGSKQLRMVYGGDGHEKFTKNVPTSEKEQLAFSLDDAEILQLARWACIIEDHYTAKMHGGDISSTATATTSITTTTTTTPTTTTTANADPPKKKVPMDMEWAKDGRTRQLFIVQARPETVCSQRDVQVITSYKLKPVPEGVPPPVPLLEGRAVGERIGQGVVQVIRDARDIENFIAGCVLVTDRTDPDWEPAMKKAAAIVTNRGGRTCHAAIISRELGVPCVVGTDKGTDVLKDGQKVTVSCAEGEKGLVYPGLLEFEVCEMNISQALSRRPHVKMMLNLANPEEAFHLAMLPNDGVGLARMEHIILNFIKVHPLALLDYEQLVMSTDPEDMDLFVQVEALTRGYGDKGQYFVDRLAFGAATLAAAFYPKDVILRFSDFKSNEYAGLLGGRKYEPTEENPMIGWRGASRYYHPKYAAGFALECKAVLRVRDVMGLTNLKVMVPFTRTPEEGRRVIGEMAKHGLVQGRNGLQVYVMCEIPSNVILADEFADVFDGFSIGSNDLTQLTLGLDRDSDIVSHLFDERSPAVKRLISEVIRVAKARGKKIGICGQGPSDFPDFAEWLLKQGIDSLSLTPDSLLKTTMHLAALGTPPAC